MWATKGPKGELAGSIAQPMPKDHLILRADSESDGQYSFEKLIQNRLVQVLRRFSGFVLCIPYYYHLPSFNLSLDHVSSKLTRMDSLFY